MELKIEYGNIDAFVPNPWNPNVQSDFIRERTQRSIDKFGFVDPLTVRETQEDNVFEILDGQHRWEEAKKLGIETLPYVNLGKVSDTIAKQLTIVLNETRGEFDTIKLSELLADLQSDIDYDELLNNLPYTKEELDSLLELPDFDWDSFDETNIEEEENEQSDEWIDIEFCVPQNAKLIIESEIERLIDTLKLRAPDKKSRYGLALEQMAILSAQTSEENIGEKK